jgi:thermostable 8-oxoguanine DNA glycosylase
MRIYIYKGIVRLVEKGNKMINMKKFNESDRNYLFNENIFMDIKHFLSNVADGYIMDYDGVGHYVYVDKKCNLYIDEDYIDFDILSEYDFKHSWYKEVEEFKNFMNTEKYHILGVFWFNK